MRALLAHHLVEIIEADLFLVQLDDFLQGIRELHVDGTIHKALGILTLLEELISVVVDVLFRNVAHAILSKLDASSLTGSFLHIIVINLDASLLREFVADQAPG